MPLRPLVQNTDNDAKIGENRVYHHAGASTQADDKAPSRLLPIVAQTFPPALLPEGKTHFFRPGYELTS